jgi:cytochrome c556
MSIFSDISYIKQTVKELKQMAKDQAAFDAQLKQAVAQVADVATDLVTQTQNINTACQAIIDKIAANPGQAVDLTAESEQLQTMQDGLTSAKQTLDGIAAQLPTVPTPPPGT